MIGEDKTTALLLSWSDGDAAAGEELVPRLYDELRALAGRRLRGERPSHTLSPTALVHEVFLRLFDQRRLTWRNRAHFFAVAGRTMRRVLVDHARHRRRVKRGGGQVPVSLEGLGDLAEQSVPDLVALDDALQALGTVDERKVKVVELHFFAGLTVAETARVLQCSETTVSREWRMAKAWLLVALEGRAEPAACSQ